LAVSVTLATFAAVPLLMSAGACCTAPAVVDQYLLPSGNSAANLLQIAGAMSEWDRHIDPQADA